ncbi:Dolichyl-diphosphooligosaccharide--protein glycosyltransferase subunit 4A [Vitis vinifera]|uniref:Dolichyl-diphosphooligosaccharide--protein glycosyltransferase subunit 4A n=2 Tax=Vitis vinifera TaxID=29760 RepID=A0A438JY34_VITVI|nr:Dolichyl-diphosphooligosaccharide--protein glycosyltransferase subunit 4A [Vitis vinifera]
MYTVASLGKFPSVNSHFESSFVHFGQWMIDDQDLGFFANFLGIFIFVLVIAYHYVIADPKYEGN